MQATFAAYRRDDRIGIAFAPALAHSRPNWMVTVVAMETPEASLPRLLPEKLPATSPGRAASTAPTADSLTLETSDEVLMQAYLAGSNSAFDRLYARYRQPLYRILLRLLDRRAVADEVFQDVWLRVVAHRSSWQPATPFRPWLLRIARNRAIDTLRQARPEQSGDAAEAWLEAAAAPGPSPEGSLSQLQSARRLEQALAALPGEQREAFLLRAELGLGHDEIADLTGVGAETAKSRLRYAYARLRAMLSP